MARETSTTGVLVGKSCREPLVTAGSTCSMAGPGTLGTGHAHVCGLSAGVSAPRSARHCPAPKWMLDCHAWKQKLYAQCAGHHEHRPSAWQDAPTAGVANSSPRAAP